MVFTRAITSFLNALAIYCIQNENRAIVLELIRKALWRLLLLPSSIRFAEVLFAVSFELDGGNFTELVSETGAAKPDTILRKFPK
jgi:hypothetical protein